MQQSCVYNVNFQLYVVPNCLFKNKEDALV